MTNQTQLNKIGQKLIYLGIGLAILRIILKITFTQIFYMINEIGYGTLTPTQNAIALILETITEIPSIPLATACIIAGIVIKKITTEPNEETTQTETDEN